MLKVTRIVIALAIVVPACCAQEATLEHIHSVENADNLEPKAQDLVEKNNVEDAGVHVPPPCTCSPTSDKAPQVTEQVIDLDAVSRLAKTKKSAKKQKSITIKISLGEENEPEPEPLVAETARTQPEPAPTSVEPELKPEPVAEEAELPKKSEKPAKKRSKRDAKSKSSGKKEAGGKEKGARKSSKGNNKGKK